MDITDHDRDCAGEDLLLNERIGETEEVEETEEIEEIEGMRILYSLLIRLYELSILIASPFSDKAHQWISGRRNLFEKLASGISKKQKWIWFHAASLGEFEQGRPLIELIHSKHPGYGILLTFFSPSGYLVRKGYPGADMVSYMPLDSAGNAKRFIEIVQPVLAVFIKYDIWYHHLAALDRAGIPVFLVSAHLRKEQIYFTPAGRFIGDQLRNVSHIFTQSESCAAMLRQKGFTHVSHAGDTRVDRVLAIAAAPKDFSWLKQYMTGAHILVAGSTWPEDEVRLIPAIHKTETSLIIAPHEVNEKRINDLESQLPGAKRLSRLKEKAEPTNVVIVDTMGDLAHLYALGHFAYVGGGFGKGIHNILEPSAYGIPVIIGPRYQKFEEAEALLHIGAVRSITTEEQLAAVIRDFTPPTSRDKIRTEIAAYLESQRGATERVYTYLVNGNFIDPNRTDK